MNGGLFWHRKSLGIRRLRERLGFEDRGLRIIIERCFHAGVVGSINETGTPLIDRDVTDRGICSGGRYTGRLSCRITAVTTLFGPLMISTQALYSQIWLVDIGTMFMLTESKNT